MHRNQFTFYRSYLDSAKKIKKASDREKYLMAILEYALDGKKPESLPESCDVAFSIAKPMLESSRRKAESASKGGSAERKQTEANRSKRKQTEANGSIEIGVGLEKEIGVELGLDIDILEQSPDNPVAQLWNQYPAHRRGELANVVTVVGELKLSPSDLYKAMDNLKIWLRAFDWTRDGGRFVPGLTKWLQSGAWSSPPPTAQLTTNPFLAMQMEEERKHDQG